jgi:hypothetical protein
VERRAGSGTYVRTRPAVAALSFGLLIPDLGETEIFEPICQGMMASPLAREHALVWGSQQGRRRSKEERAWELCRQYIDRRVSGVFFAPLELTPAKDEVNLRIARALDEAHIPVVLLDRTVVPYPQRGHHDLVGIDNRRAGYLVTEHLLRLGARRIAFVGVGNAAATVDARASGYREALAAWEIGVRPCARPADGSRGRGGRARSHGRGPSRRDRLRERSDGGASDAHAPGVGARRARRRAPRRDRRRGIRRAAPGAAHHAAPADAQIGAAAMAAMLDRVAGAGLPRATSCCTGP